MFAIAASIFAIILVVTMFSGFFFGPAGPSNPFGPGEGPPRIVMASGGQEQAGQLLGYAYSEAEPFAELPPVNTANVTSVSANTVSLDMDSQLRFRVEGNPAPEARFDSLAVTAFTSDGRPLRVLGATEPEDDTYSLAGLGEGEYVLVSTATWTPEEERETISGYVIYGHRIVISSPA